MSIQVKHKMRPFDRMWSFFSLLDGLASKKDRDYVRMRNHINRGKYNDTTKASIKPVHTTAGQAYDTLWLESPYGAYAVTKTRLPIDQRKLYQKLYKKPQVLLKDAYCVLFSPYTEFLDTALTAHPKSKEYPSEKDIESYIEVHAAYLEEDLAYKNDFDDRGSLVDMSWVQQIVHDHMAQNEKRLKTHGTLLHTDENVYRSGSSVLWYQESKKQPGYYDCFYYGNPAEGEDMLYVTEDMLSKGWLRGALRLASKKINKAPIRGEDRHRFARQEFLNISKQIMRHSDPYDLYKNNDDWARIEFERRYKHAGTVKRSWGSAKFYAAQTGRKIGHPVKRETLRLIQKMSHDVATIDTHAMGFTMVGALALMSVMVIWKLAAAVVVRASEVAIRGVSSLFKAATKYAMPPKTGTYRYLNDYAHLKGARDTSSKSLITKETKGRPIDAYFLQHSTLVPAQMLGALYPYATRYTNEGENQRVEGLLLDTTRYPCGTVISERKYGERHFLVVEQPDGIVIHRDAEQQMALASHGDRALIGAYLDGSVRRRFAQLAPHETMLGVRFKRNEGLRSKGFSSFDDAQHSHFYPSEPITYEDVTSQVVDFDTQARHQDICTRTIEKRQEKPTFITNMMKSISKGRLTGGFEEAAKMPDFKEEILCSFNPACGPIFKKSARPQYQGYQEPDFLKQSRVNHFAQMRMPTKP